MKMNEDFMVTDTDVRYRNLDVVATIKIIKGEFKDVEFHFGSINIPDEENDDGTFTLSFDYDIISEHKQFKGNQEFENTLGNIMNEILHHSLEEAEKRYKNESREKDTKTLNIG